MAEAPPAPGSREAKLAAALRDNLRRRKEGPAPAPPPPAAPEPSRD